MNMPLLVFLCVLGSKRDHYALLLSSFQSQLLWPHSEAAVTISTLKNIQKDKECISKALFFILVSKVFILEYVVNV